MIKFRTKFSAYFAVHCTRAYSYSANVGHIMIYVNKLIHDTWHAGLHRFVAKVQGGKLHILTYIFAIWPPEKKKKKNTQVWSGIQRGDFMHL